jgi:hypothetical protein
VMGVEMCGFGLQHMLIERCCFLELALLVQQAGLSDCGRDVSLFLVAIDLVSKRHQSLTRCMARANAKQFVDEQGNDQKNHSHVAVRYNLFGLRKGSG